MLSSRQSPDSALGIALGIIEGDRSWLPTLIGSVIPLLSLSIESCERGAPNAKHTIANVRSYPGHGSSKRCRTGQSSSTAGKMCLKGGKAVGTIKGLHYDKSIWDAMTKEQRDKTVELRKTKSSQCAVKAAMTLGLNPPLSTVEDKLEKLARAMKSIKSSHGNHGRSADRNSNSCQRNECYQSGS